MTKIRALVVDDEPQILRILRRSLTAHDYEVHVAADGATALDTFHDFPPDLVITDLHMPHGGGLALTSALRRDVTTKDVPIVVLTGYGGGSDWRDLKAHGADRFLVKPVDIDILVSVVRSLTDRRRAGPAR